jgi:quercetin dioxygenase-like cupin family protein
MPHQFVLRAVASSLATLSLTTCATTPTPPVSSVEGVGARSGGLVLQAHEGERRVRRAAGGAPFILKVDRRNGGSPDLVMGYEDLPPGYVIPPHRHLLADEIIFVHQGSGVASLGGHESPVSAGATIYIPRNVTINLRNTGNTPLSIAFIFSKPGFEELLRETSVLEGQPVLPLSETEVARLRAKHRSHVVYDQP